MNVKSVFHPIVKEVRTLLDIRKLNIYRKSTFYENIKSLKNVAKGKRCFIIGNGPSLTIKDLELIKEEDCFACNRIYGLYENTKWRPKYYGIQDPKVLKTIVELGELEKAVDGSEFSFFPYHLRNNFANLLNDNRIQLFYKRYISIYTKDGTHKEGFIPFSSDLKDGLYDGMSITYGLMQIAVYMGYSEIYLLGIDHNYTIKKGVVDSGKSYAEGIRPIDMSKQLLPELKICEISFREARRYMESTNIVIKNATRGGNLKIFERIELENILDKKQLTKVNV